MTNREYYPNLSCEEYYVAGGATIVLCTYRPKHAKINLSVDSFTIPSQEEEIVKTKINEWLNSEVDKCDSKYIVEDYHYKLYKHVKRF